MIDKAACITNGCDRPNHARGMCSSCYSRWYRQTLYVPTETVFSGLCDCDEPDIRTTLGMCHRCSFLHRDYLSPANRQKLEDKERGITSEPRTAA